MTLRFSILILAAAALLPARFVCLVADARQASPHIIFILADDLGYGDLESSISHQTICFTDFLATCAEICKVDLPADSAPDSFSFLPVLESRQPADKPVRGPIVMQAGSTRSMMIRSGDWN